MLGKNYNYYLFDVDRTIWAFDKNAHSAICKLLDHFFVGERFGITDKDEFVKRYETINKHLWQRYEAGEITKEMLRSLRFLHTFKSYFKHETEDGTPVNEFPAKYKKIKRLSDKFTVAYVEQMVTETILEPGADIVLRTLHERGKKIAVITNGFAEMQYRKLANSRIGEYIDAYIISEEVGYLKPHPNIFMAALNALGGVKSQTLMVGDDLANDIYGARDFGIDQYYYNPFHKGYDNAPTYDYPTLLNLV